MKNTFIIIISILFILSGCSEKSCKPAEIRVVSYNLRYDNPRDSLNSWPYRKENVKAMFRYHDFDIVGTQEGLYNQLTDICELPEYTYFGGGRDDGKDAGEHSAIIYKKDRFQIIESGNFWLSETPEQPGLGWDATCCNRICSWVKFKDLNTGKAFYFFNVHFDHQGVVARRESAKLMVAKIKETVKDAPVVCTGDFNARPDSEPMQIMFDFLIDSRQTSKMPPYGPEGTFNGFRFDAPLNNRIDYILINDLFSVNKYAVLTDALEQRYPSDHMPVVADMILK